MYGILERGDAELSQDALNRILRFGIGRIVAMSRRERHGGVVALAGKRAGDGDDGVLRHGWFLCEEGEQHVRDRRGLLHRRVVSARRTRKVGQSPRVRGTGRGRWHPSRRHQLIPRACWEQRNECAAWLDRHGSSPRVRGTAVHQRGHELCGRFIPARAGNRRRRPGRTRRRAVHPRVCGEQPETLSVSVAPIGSSPRVRGTDRLGRLKRGLRRFIPACAGNRLDERFRHAEGAVHPRVCGEQRRIAMCSGLTAGSSPRVRGTGVHSDPAECRRRFIPACAGNSRTDLSARHPDTVHPRVCGEQSRKRAAS